MSDASSRVFAEGEMNVTEHHSRKITICTSCRHKVNNCRPDLELIDRLPTVLAIAGRTVLQDFEISGAVCIAGCDRPCTAVYHATAKATHLFGDIDPGVDIDDLVVVARQYRDPADGWHSSTARPGKLRRTTLVRVPAALNVSEEGPVK
ncbi:DUF1636 family protein [Aestuariibius insulae]|uniref:DUF1636 family protein n=1 Tax=Aestuariibius insulae TaxID=2058287 RepID=UPI00398EEC00